MLPYNKFTNEVRIGDIIDHMSYFITIRKHRVKEYVDVDDIINIIEYLYTKIPSLRLGIYSFEIDKKYRQLYFHGLVQMKKQYFNYKSVVSHNGFRIYWKPVYHHYGLKKYINKDIHNKYKQEEIISDNYFTHPEAPNRFI